MSGPMHFDPTPEGWAAFREALRRARAAAEADPEAAVSFPVLGTWDYHLRLPEGRTRIADLRFPDGDTLEVSLEDGRRVTVPLAWFPILRDALPEEREQTEPLAGGAALHFPALNTEVAVDDVLFCRGGWDEEARIAREVTPERLIYTIEALIWRWLSDHRGVIRSPGGRFEVDPAAFENLLSLLRERMAPRFPGR